MSATTDNQNKAAEAIDFGIEPLSRVERKPLDRYVTGFADRCWGTQESPGIVTSSVTLFGGEPGAGKSTFFLQLIGALYRLTKRPGIYVSLEENEEQVLDRAMRLGIDVESILILTNEKWREGKAVDLKALQHFRPSCVVTDSIQKMGGGALEYCEYSKRLAQAERVPFFIVCQANSSDDFAGGKRIQDEADTLIYMSQVSEIQGLDKRVHHPPDLSAETGGASIESWRIITTRKNKFGTLNERYFIMRREGLVPWDLPPSTR